MNIAVLAHSHHPIIEPFAGGLEAHTHHLVDELTRQGHRVTLYAKAGSDRHFTTVAIYNGNAQNGNNPDYDKAYEYAMKKVARRTYDLIINNSLNHMPIKLHTSTMAPMITIFHTPPLPKVLPIMKRQLARDNRTYIAVSELTAGEWQPYCNQSVQVVSNGIDVAKWQFNARTFSDHAVWMGRITPEKGLDVAIAAAKEARIVLRIGGGIYDKTYFENKIQPQIDDRSIIYLGHLSQAQMNKEYCNAAVALVTPMWNEPFGLVAIEAMASGTPVAALPNGALPSIVSNNVGIIATTESASDLASAILDAMKKDRAACRAYVETAYTLETMTQAYLNTVTAYQPTVMSDLRWQATL